MMPSPAYTEAKLRARYHVQVEVEEREEVDSTPAHPAVSGRVRHVFRGDDLRFGDVVRFSVAVVRKSEVDKIPAGGLLWMTYSAFQNTTYFEVFLDGEPPECHVVRSQVFSIECLSERPQIPAPTKKEVNAEWAEWKRKALRSSAIGPFWRAWVLHKYAKTKAWVFHTYVKGKVLVHKFVEGS